MVSKPSRVKQYLEKSEFLNEIEICSDPVKIAAEEDVWIVQCPKNITLKRLKGEKLKFPGKTSLDGIELICEEFPKRRMHPMAMGPGQVRLLPIQGTVVVREKLMKPIKVEKSSEDVIKPRKTVPFPEGLVERHPLLGLDYAEKIVLRKDVEERLAHCHDIVHKKVKREIIKIKSEDEALQPTQIKKEKKKKKRQLSESEPQPVKKKKVKSEQQEEISAELSWLKNI